MSTSGSPRAFKDSNEIPLVSGLHDTSHRTKHHHPCCISMVGVVGAPEEIDKQVIKPGYTVPLKAQKTVPQRMKSICMRNDFYRSRHVCPADLDPIPCLAFRSLNRCSE